MQQFNNPLKYIDYHSIKKIFLNSDKIQII